MYKIAILIKLSILCVSKAYSCPSIDRLPLLLKGSFEGEGVQNTRYNQEKLLIKSSSVVKQFGQSLLVQTKTTYLDDFDKVVKRHNAKYWLKSSRLGECEDGRRVYYISSSYALAGYKAYFDGDEIQSRQNLGSKMFFDMRTIFSNNQLETIGHFMKGDRLMQKNIIVYTRVD